MRKSFKSFKNVSQASFSCQLPSFLTGCFLPNPTAYFSLLQLHTYVGEGATKKAVDDGWIKDNGWMHNRRWLDYELINIMDK